MQVARHPERMLLTLASDRALRCIRASVSATGPLRYAAGMPTLSFIVLLMTAGLLALLLFMLRLANQPSLPRLVGELAGGALLLGALGWGMVTMAQHLPR